MKLALRIFCSGIFFSTIFGFSEESYYLEPLISQEEIAKRISVAAKDLNEEYAAKHPLIISNLKGAVCFTADLIRELQCPFSLEFIQCSSYGMRGSKRGELTISGLEKLDLEGKDVLIVDDIFDSGVTMFKLVEKIKQKNPASIKTIVLLLKNSPSRTVDYKPDYVLFEIDDYFTVGYGIDYKEQFRGLKGIYNYARR